MIVTTAQLYKLAYGKYAIGAYNINNLEQTMGLFRGCLESQAPFIIQLSKGARKYADKRMLEAIIRTAEEIFPDAIFAVHLDHGDEESCYDCIDSGFYSSVMIDASHEILRGKRRHHQARRGPRARQGHQRRGRTRPARRRGGRHQGGRGPRQPDQPDRGRRVRPPDGLRRAGGGHRHEPRRVQVQGPAEPALRRDPGHPGENPRHAHRHARQQQRAAGGGPAHQRGRAARSTRARAAWTKTNTCPPPSSA